jgi:hypothetical protein
MTSYYTPLLARRKEFSPRKTGKKSGRRKKRKKERGLLAQSPVIHY